MSHDINSDSHLLMKKKPCINKINIAIHPRMCFYVCSLPCATQSINENLKSAQNEHKTESLPTVPLGSIQAPPQGRHHQWKYIIKSSLKLQNCYALCFQHSHRDLAKTNGKSCLIPINNKLFYKLSKSLYNQAKNKNLFVCPLPSYSPKMGPTQKILLPFYQIFFSFFFFFLNVSVRR